MQPSEPASPDEDDIPFAKYEPMFPNLEPAPDPELPFVLRPNPDPACRFVIVEALIVLICCGGCLWHAVRSHRIVDTGPWQERNLHFIGAKDGMLQRDYVLNFLIGLGPSCPLTLLNQYLLRKRRTWPTLPEWAWMYSSAWAIFGVVASIDFGPKDSLGSTPPQAFLLVLLGFWALSYLLLLGAGPLVLLVLSVNPLSAWRRMAWTQWLAIVSTFALGIIAYFEGLSEPLL